MNTGMGMGAFNAYAKPAGTFGGASSPMGATGSQSGKPGGPGGQSTPSASAFGGASSSPPMGAIGSQSGKPGGPGGQSTSPSTSAAGIPKAGAPSAGATGQVSSTPNAQGLYTDVVGGHTYSQATPWQQYQIDALNKGYAAGATGAAGAMSAAGATGAASAGQLGHGHPHAFTGDREKRAANQQQFFQNQYGGNWQQAMQNQQAFGKASAKEEEYMKQGRLTQDPNDHSKILLDGKPYTAPNPDDLSTYASYGGKALNPNAGQVYSDGSPYVTKTLNPLQQFLSQQQPNTGSMTGHSPMGQQGHKHGGLLSLINKR
jgi:hypothetical protein